MSTYEILLFGHLLFVIAWVGSNIALHFLSFRAQAAGPVQTAEFLGTVEAVGKFLLTPSALLVVVFGVLLVEEVGYEFSQTWITLAFAAFGFSFVLGAGFLGPEAGRISNLLAERPAEDAEVQRRIRRILWLSRLELLILIAVVLDMVAKPGL